MHILEKRLKNNDLSIHLKKLVKEHPIKPKGRKKWSNIANENIAKCKNWGHNNINSNNKMGRSVIPKVESW